VGHDPVRKRCVYGWSDMGCNPFADKRAGDGTTTSVIMTQAIVNEGLKYVKSGVSPTSLRTGIMKTTKMLTDKIPELARCVILMMGSWASETWGERGLGGNRKVKDSKDVLNIAIVATSGDVPMAEVITKTFDRVNLDAMVSRFMRASYDGE
jgi:chaperonin GroEL (HSP60 family)